MQRQLVTREDRKMAVLPFFYFFFGLDFFFFFFFCNKMKSQWEHGIYPDEKGRPPPSTTGQMGNILTVSRTKYYSIRTSRGRHCNALGANRRETPKKKVTRKGKGKHKHTVDYFLASITVVRSLARYGSVSIPGGSVFRLNTGGRTQSGWVGGGESHAAAE